MDGSNRALANVNLILANCPSLGKVPKAEGFDPLTDRQCEWYEEKLYSFFEL